MRLDPGFRQLAHPAVMAEMSIKAARRPRLEQHITEALARLEMLRYTGRLTITVDFNQGGITGAITSESRRLELK